MRALLAVALVFACLALAPKAARAQSCTTSVSAIDFGSVSPVSGTTSVDSSGILSISCSRLNLLGLPLPVTIALCPNLDAGSGGSSGSQRLLAGPSSSTLPYQIYQDAARSIPWGSAAFLQFGATPTFYFTSNTSGVISASRPVYARLNPQGTAKAGVYASTFSGENFFWGVNILSCAGLTVGFPTSPPPFTVSATVTADCVMTTTPLDFGTVGLIGTTRTAQTPLTVTCTSGAPFSIALGPGSAAAGPTQRRMYRGSESILYALYRDAARTQPWGDSTGQLLSATGAGTPLATYIYGAVPAQTAPTAGTYSDTVVVTLQY